MSELIFGAALGLLATLPLVLVMALTIRDLRDDIRRLERTIERITERRSMGNA